jgi:type IV pilus assembly protein PilC
MPHYRYQARSSDGSVQSGVLSADNAVTAAAILRNQGHHVLALAPTQSAALHAKSIKQKLSALNVGSGPSQKDVLDFTTQLAVMIRAGISIRAALDGIAEQTDNVGFRNILYQLKNDVESGKQFSEAIAKHPKQFSLLYVNMVKASEMSGSFAKMLDRIAAYMTQQIETRKMVIGAMIYPGVIATMAVGVTIFLLTFVLPKFGQVFKGKEELLPWATNFLMGLSKWLVTFWYIPLAATVAGVFGLILFAKTDFGRLTLDRLKLGLPIFRNMFRSLYISRGLHTMAELLNAGVPMLDTLKITGDISGNQLYKAMWRSVAKSVKEGKKIAQPLQRSGLLPKAVVQMISAGEESGKLGEVLSEISAFYARQLKDNIKAVTSMIEPIMIIVMGGIVGFIAMAIILPIFKMSSVVS